MSIATADELRQATSFHRERMGVKTRDELLMDWAERFPKIADRAIREAVRQGLYSCQVPIPYQPAMSEEQVAWVRELRIGTMRLDAWVRAQLPGCTVTFVEEAMAGVVGGWFTLEISWV